MGHVARISAQVYLERRDFDALANATQRPIHLLGRCPEGERATRLAGMTGGPAERAAFRKLWPANASAMELYRNYKYVIAFENTPALDGYMTEKIVNAV